MSIEINDYFEDINGNKYQVIHKNHNEITVVVRTNRDVSIQIKDKNFFEKEYMKKKTGNPFCNIKNLSRILNDLISNEDVFFLGYIKYYNNRNCFAKRKAHNVYELLFETSRRYISLMISENPAFELLTDWYYTATWGYDLKKKEIIALTDMDEITEDNIGVSKENVVIKEKCSITEEKNSILLNSVLKIYTDLREIQVEELDLGRDSYVVENKKDFIERIGG